MQRMVDKARLVTAVSLAVVVATLAIVTIMYQFGLGLVGFWMTVFVVFVLGWLILGTVDDYERKR